MPSGVLSVLPGYGESTGVEIAKHHYIRKIDVTVRIFDLNHRIALAEPTQASTRVGRSLGTIAGSNLAALTAELGGKVRARVDPEREYFTKCIAGADSHL